MADISIAHKVCPGCKTDKVSSAFSKNRNTRSGLDSHCKDCKHRQKQIRKNSIPRVTTKTCSSCLTVKPASSFYVRVKSLDGLNHQCIGCTREVGKANKRCPRCKATKPITDFSNNKRAKDGRAHYCKSCAVQMGALNYRKYNERHKKYNRERRRDPGFRTRRRAIYNKYRGTEKGKRTVLNAALKHEFGITLEEYEVMLKAQNEVCAICGQRCTRNTRLSVDHDHETGRVRGLLCNRCNNALGQFQDNASLLKRAATYLESD